VKPLRQSDFGWSVSPVAIESYRRITGSKKSELVISKKFAQILMHGVYEGNKDGIDFYYSTSGDIEIAMSGGEVIDCFKKSADFMGKMKRRVPSDIKITAHAVERFKQRRERNDLDDRVVETSILKMLTHGTEVTPVNKVASLLYNRLHEARYFQHGDLIAVLVDKTVVTCSKNLSGKWRVKDGD